MDDLFGFDFDGDGAVDPAEAAMGLGLLDELFGAPDEENDEDD